jgi:hypothetical protein
MGAPAPEDILFVPGRLAINPTNLATAWPHGGTGLGMVEACALELTEKAYDVWAQEWGCVADQIEQESRWAIGFQARGQDETLLPYVVTQTATGATSGKKKLLWDPSATGYKPGRRRSARAVVLLFTPDAQSDHRAILFRCALPNLATERALINLEHGDELKTPLVFLAVPSASKTPAEWALLEDITL